MGSAVLSGFFLLVVGLSLGLFGAGGSAIAVPVLVYINGMEPHQAVAVALLLVGASSLFGGFLNWRAGRICWRSAPLFTLFGVVGAWIGAQASYLLSGRTLLLCFSGLIVAVAGRMLFEKSPVDDGLPHRPHRVILAIAAFAIGAVTGTLGVGGGFLIVPSMIYLAGLPVRDAIGTSLVVVAANSLVAFGSHLVQGRLDLSQVPLLLACALAGMFAGHQICERSHPDHLQRGFAVLLLGLAAFMIYRNWN